MTTDQRVVAKQDIQEVKSAKRAGAPYAHHRNQARDANTKLRQQLANAPRARRYRDETFETYKDDAHENDSSLLPLRLC